MKSLWENDEAIFDIAEHLAPPKWIDRDLTPADVAAIIQGGCASGAYMPSVTYYDAAQTMAEYGDEVLQYIENAYGEIPQPKTGMAWSSMACFYLSMAVELWALSIEKELVDALRGV